jgi:hypothetical protein
VTLPVHFQDNPPYQQFDLGVKFTFDSDDVPEPTPEPQPEPIPEPQPAAPTDITISNTSFDENINANSYVAALDTIDTNTDYLHYYTLVSGEGDSDNDEFWLNGDNILHIKTSPDYESKSSYSVRIKQKTLVD